MRRGLLVLAVLAALCCASAGKSAWSRTSAGTGAAGSKAFSASSGAAPVASVSSHSVTLTWSVAQYADGTVAPAYVVKRYDAVSSALQTTLSNCTGLISGTTCTENAVPTGTWKYTITPAVGAWLGTASAMSASVVVLV